MMESGQMEPAAALQAVLLENEALRKENRGLKEMLVQVSKLIAPYLPVLVQPEESKLPKLDPIFEQDIADLELSVRSVNVLTNSGIQSFGQLVSKTEREILRIKFIGRRSLDEIKEFLRTRGLRFGMSEADMIAWSKEREKR